MNYGWWPRYPFYRKLISLSFHYFWPFSRSYCSLFLCLYPLLEFLVRFLYLYDFWCWRHVLFHFYSCCDFHCLAKNVVSSLTFESSVYVIWILTNSSGCLFLCVSESFCERLVSTDFSINLIGRKFDTWLLEILSYCLLGNVASTLTLEFFFFTSYEFRQGPVATFFSRFDWLFRNLFFIMFFVWPSWLLSLIYFYINYAALTDGSLWSFLIGYSL